MDTITWPVVALALASITLVLSNVGTEIRRRRRTQSVSREGRRGPSSGPSLVSYIHGLLGAMCVRIIFAVVQLIFPTALYAQAEKRIALLSGNQGYGIQGLTPWSTRCRLGSCHGNLHLAPHIVGQYSEPGC